MSKRKTLFGVPYEWYTVKDVSIPVSVIGMNFSWNKIHGLQFGDWFIGAIKGKKQC